MKEALVKKYTAWAKRVRKSHPEFLFLSRTKWIQLCKKVIGKKTSTKAAFRLILAICRLDNEESVLSTITCIEKGEWSEAARKLRRRRRNGFSVVSGKPRTRQVSSANVMDVSSDNTYAIRLMANSAAAVNVLKSMRVAPKKIHAAEISEYLQQMPQAGVYTSLEIHGCLQACGFSGAGEASNIGPGAECAILSLRGEDKDLASCPGVGCHSKMLRQTPCQLTQECRCPKDQLTI